MKATINFKTSEQAETFAIQWTRKTLLGHTVANKTVSLYGITDEFKIFIDTYISQLNK